MDALPTADEVLVRSMVALANINRLGIVRALRVPRALHEIEVRDEGVGQILARQTIRRHLDVLLEAGIVASRDAGREYGDTSEFIVNHQRLFAVSEEVRGLSRLRPSVEIESETLPRRNLSGPRVSSPCLVLVRGLEEGQRFGLDPVAGKRSWVLGRRRGLDISLDFDPSTSSENSILRWEEDHHTLEDIDGSLNGTSHNFRELAPQERVRLRHGDIVGAGRCLLVYWR